MNRVYKGNNSGAEETARITAGLVHDLNNLLMVLCGYIDLLNIKSSEYVSLREVLSNMEGAVQQGREISRRIMDVCISNLERALNSLPLKNEKDELDINQVVSNVVNMARSKLNNGVTIATYLEPRLLLIKGDALDIQRLLVNLTENAHAAIPGKGIIKLSTQNITRGNCFYVSLSVRDTGMGMDQSVMNQIFKPCFTTKKDGHGMGMSVVKQVAEDHGGWTEVKSVPGQGTEVNVYFPANKDAGPGES